MENYRINPVSKTLTISAAFEKAMSNPESEEYRYYVQLQRDIPGLKVSRRTHKSPTEYHTKSGDVFRCNQYKHLTYENMERFIKALPQSDELIKVYTAVRRWFAAQFPNFRKNPIFYFNQDFPVIYDIWPIIKEVQEKSVKKDEAA